MRLKIDIFMCVGNNQNIISNWTIHNEREWFDGWIWMKRNSHVYMSRKKENNNTCYWTRTKRPLSTVQTIFTCTKSALEDIGALMDRYLCVTIHTNNWWAFYFVHIKIVRNSLVINYSEYEETKVTCIMYISTWFFFHYLRL
jgi:hypothetical protein